jgi:hypothetical protein
MSKMSEAHLDNQENPVWGNKVNYTNPAFQKRHFEFLADSFKKIFDKNKTIDPAKLLYLLADELQTIAPKFNKEIFLKRAGIKNDDK